MGVAHDAAVPSVPLWAAASFLARCGLCLLMCRLLPQLRVHYLGWLSRMDAASANLGPPHAYTAV